MRLLLVLFLALLWSAAQAQDPSYDHQTTTYKSQFQPVSVTNAHLSITPFFSPDHSCDTQAWLVGNATQTVDIGAPGWDSWAYCADTTEGCTPYDLRNTDNFPLWCALLNALHRGVKVRLLTNDYTVPGVPAKGMIDPLTFLYLNGAEIRFFATVTFLHEKYIASESETSISSVNFDYTSYMENREAGVVISGSGSSPLRSFSSTVYESDWSIAVPFYPNQNYSSDDMKTITDPAAIPVVIPPRPNINAPITPRITVTQYQNASVITSPDFAYQAITTSMSQAKESVAVFIYQITDIMCSYMLNLVSQKPNLKWTILVSRVIYDPSDSQQAQICYGQLTNKGLSVRVTTDAFSYSHQKYWLIDFNNSTIMSTSIMYMSTGNWGSTDYPDGSVFPPYTQPGWAAENRDYTYSTNDWAVMTIFYNVLAGDLSVSSPWKPS